MTDYIPTYEIVITEEVKGETNKLLFSVHLGSDAVAKLYKLAEAGIPEAKKIEFSWGYNVDIYFDAAGLAEFTKHEYRQYHNFFTEKIGDGKTYLLCALDWS